MYRVLREINQKDHFSLSPTPYISTLNYETQPISSPSSPSSKSSFSRISPELLLAIIILAVIFFICGVLHLLLRFLIKRSSFSAIHHSNRFQETSGNSQTLQRQLQQLFRQHDSGLDQAFIDGFPVFNYKDIMGLKEPFDCAVCLYEFSDREKLRLLPICSHAFHIHCIDTWLLSNSTCPLCRGTLFSSTLSHMENPWFNIDPSMEISNDGDNSTISSNAQKPVTVEEINGEKRVLSVKLGKFRSLNGGGGSENTAAGESSRCNLDARRCYSMGTVQYVVADSYLQVAMSSSNENAIDRTENGPCHSLDEEMEGKKIMRGRTRGDSFSVSKIWLWSKKSKFPVSSNNPVNVSFSADVSSQICDGN